MRRAITVTVAVAILLGILAVLNANAAYSRQPDAPTSASIVASGPQATPTCAPSWSVVPSAEVSSTSSALNAVDAVASNDVWAVGRYEAPGASRARRPQPQEPGLLPENDAPSSPGQETIYRTLIERWNGNAWTVVPSPNVGTDHNILLMVDAVSANDVWAVGYYVDAMGIARTLTHRWNGSAWTVVPSPNVGPYLDNQLTSIDAVSSTDAWAVGYYYDEEGKSQTLTLRWNNGQWNIVPSPNLGEASNRLYDVVALSGGDAWAVGTYLTSVEVNRSLTLRWNGATWSSVPSPAVGSGLNILYSVDAVASNDVWAGGGFSSTSGSSRPLTQHWDGTAWTVIAPAAAEQRYSVFFSVDAIAANDVWAVGGSAYSAPRALAEHWDGTSWSVTRNPAGDPYSYRLLRSVDALSSTDVWAVGEQEGAPYRIPLVQHYSTACVTCGIRFMDVPEGSTFFDAILCLSCQGVVGGYSPPPPPPPPPVPTGEPYPTYPPTMPPTPTPSGPTFRPNLNVTRGQFAKIVSNSADYIEDPGRPIFQDVPQYSTFYEWINRLARRGILGGYPCGTRPDEPCIAPGNLPYFRPNADATRAQIAKIVSNAAGFAEPHTAQAFEDVPASHPFYIWIARLSSRGVIGGYQCGSIPQEPCRTGNRAYFRPDNNATRGQVSKMVAKAFFPNCYVP